MPINIARGRYDIFQNICCPSISESKLCCNTNVSVVLPGPIAQYTFKYNLKPNQQEDTEEYQKVAETTRKLLSKPRVHEKDQSEAMR